MGLKRTTRLIHLLSLLQSNSETGLIDLAKFFEVSRRTVFRDLQDLQKAGVPCYYDHSSKGYRIGDDYFMPPPNLTSEEAFGLLLLARKAGKMLNIPFAKTANKAAAKIESTLPHNVKKKCRQLLETVSVMPPRSILSDSTAKAFSMIRNAITNKRMLLVSYYPDGNKNIIRDSLKPLHLYYSDGWYAIGKVSLHKEFQSIKLSDIQTVEDSGKCFIENGSFDIREYIGRAWSAKPEGRLYIVKLRFSPQIAQEVISCKWHDTQYSELEEDGYAIIEFRVDGLREISRWIIGYGNNVEIIAPHALKELVNQMVGKISEHCSV